MFVYYAPEDGIIDDVYFIAPPFFLRVFVVSHIVIGGLDFDRLKRFQLVVAGVRRRKHQIPASLNTPCIASVI